ncbi:hypothetical protein EI983_02340 [Roseovarius faecimaris]|uniref:DUF304 domain-containing protein n=1 Tax=Roseovarius faecimaris TaxID=2494550 RepID=A0A6I6IK30_9RHOB|nr:hypothetical protein [Roseovarius faecimaris]QGX97179.1 hypothetical protein EI983_02340 [Roseovarius faecimaris]
MTDSTSYALHPTSELAPGEQVLTSFQADRGTYIRDHAWMAALGMAGGMLVLWALGNAHVWTGAVGGLAAIALRGWYVASDELGVRWDLTNQRLLGPQTRAIALENIAQVRTLGSAVQVISRTGEKYLLKYQADAKSVRAQIEAGAGGADD